MRDTGSENETPATVISTLPPVLQRDDREKWGDGQGHRSLAGHGRGTSSKTVLLLCLCRDLNSSFHWRRKIMLCPTPGMYLLVSLRACRKGLLLFIYLDWALDLHCIINKVIAGMNAIISIFLINVMLQQDTDKSGSWSTIHSQKKIQHNASKAGWPLPGNPGTCARYQRHFLA